MKILVLGGTGRSGRRIAAQLVADGHKVTVAGRRDPGITGARFQAIDLMDADALRAAAAGMDAVVSALAAAKGNPVCSAVARTLAGNDGLRFITIAGGGVDAAGGREGNGRQGDRLDHAPRRARDAGRPADGTGHPANSRLRWTMLRPPRLTDAQETGRSRITFDRPASKAISRADLAQAAVDALSDDTLIGRAPFVAG